MAKVEEDTWFTREGRVGVHPSFTNGYRVSIVVLRSCVTKDSTGISTENVEKLDFEQGNFFEFG